MKLIGKCKTEFENWILNNKSNHDSTRMVKIFNQKDLFVSYVGIGETFLNALIIEFFDSVGIWGNIFYYEYRKTKFQDYKEAINKSIIKANEIYNSK